MAFSIPRMMLPVAAAMIVFSSASLASANEIYATDGVAIHGFDAVAYFTDHKPVKGNKAFSASYKGATFHFVSAEHRDAFIGDPVRYAPQYGGYCAYGTARGYKAPTEPQAFTVVNDKLYLNYNDDVAETWRKDISGYIRKANANWDTVRTQPAP